MLRNSDIFTNKKKIWKWRDDHPVKVANYAVVKLKKPAKIQACQNSNPDDLCNTSAAL